MGLLNFPPPPPSPDLSAVSEVYRRAIVNELNHVLQHTVPRGASVRLYILFGLMVYGVVSGLAFLIITFVDYQRRAKRTWIFRFVHRPKGRYIVGNQHVVFTAFSIISCLVLIGFAESSRRALILHRGMADAFYWRNLVYVPILAHGWVSSFSILQASILGSERALNKQILSPRVVNLVYIVGIVVTLSSALTLDIFIARTWSQAWIQTEAVRSLLTTGTDLTSTITTSSLVAKTSSILHKFRVFDRTERAVCCIYLLGAICCVFINLAGLSLLLILRRQIRYNSVKFAGEAREQDHAPAQDVQAQAPPREDTPYPRQDRKMSNASGGSKSTQTSSYSGTAEGSDLSKFSGKTAANSMNAQFVRRDSGVDPLCRRDESRGPPHIIVAMDSPFSQNFSNFDPFSRDNASQSPPLTPRRDSNVDSLFPSPDEPSSRSTFSDFRRDSTLSNVSSSTLRPRFERRPSLFHKVIFALAPNEEESNDDPEAKQAENAHEEKAMKMATTARLRAEVEKAEPEGAAQREWARQLLALKRVEWDLVVFIVAIVSLAVVLFCVSLWTAITPSSIYRSPIRIEISLFLFPWIYLTVVAVAHTSLLYNAYMNLTPISSVSVPAHHVFLQSARAQLNKESIDLLENDFDL